MSQPLKVLHVINSLRKGGAERLCVTICNALSLEGNYEVGIFILEDLNEFENELNSSVRVFTGDIEIALSIKGKNSIKNQDYVKCLKDFNPDIIHSHLPWADILTHSHILSETQYFSHLHSSQIRELTRFKISGISKRAITNLYERKWLLKHYKKAKTHFIACSNGALNFYEQNIRLGKEMVHVLPNAIPLNVNPPADIQSVSKLINVGTLSDVKNQLFLLEVIHKISTTNSAIHLTILGEGSNREALEKRIDELNISNQVSMPGNVNNVEEIMCEHHLYVHSSKHEGLPMVFIEALNCNLPIVTTDCMVNNEVIEENINGFILEENISIFTDQINKIVSDKDLYHQLRENTHKTVKKFDIKDYIKKLAIIYIQ